MSPAMIPPGVQDHGVPFDVFIQAITLQLDKAQAGMALKARVGKLPLTFAVKDVSLDLRACLEVLDGEVWVRPAGPGDTHASSIKLSLTTITKPMIDENAVSYEAEDSKFSIREVLGNTVSEEEQRSLERMGVRTLKQLQDLKRAAGADVVARLTRMPVNRLQQALLAAQAPRITQVVSPSPDLSRPRTPQIHMQVPTLKKGQPLRILVKGQAVPFEEREDGELVLQPLAEQMGLDADIQFETGQRATLPLRDGQLATWHGDPPEEPC